MLTTQAPATSAPVTRRTVAPVGAAVPAPGERGHLQHALVSAIRTRHYSRRTKQAYWHWTRQFVLWSGKRHPIDMGAPEIGAFLTHLATERNVSASTQRQALAALLFLYREALQIELPWVDNIVRAKQAQRLPAGTRRDCRFSSSARHSAARTRCRRCRAGRPRQQALDRALPGGRACRRAQIQGRWLPGRWRQRRDGRRWRRRQA